MKTSYFLAFSFEILHPCESHNMNPLHVWERLPNNKKYFFYSSLPHWEAFICFKVLELINGFSTSLNISEQYRASILTSLFFSFYTGNELCQAYAHIMPWLLILPSWAQSKLKLQLIHHFILAWSFNSNFHPFLTFFLSIFNANPDKQFWAWHSSAPACFSIYCN